MELNEGQQKALAMLKSNENVYLFGPAGTGKTTVVKRFLEESETPVTVLCSTASAAVIIGSGARTFHSFFGIKPSAGRPMQDIVEEAAENFKVRRRIKGSKVILIDEISMIDAYTFSLACMIVMRIEGNSEVWGGKIFKVVGDFYQLCPILKDKNNKPDWIFKSPAWDACDFKLAELTQIMRTQDKEFLEILKNVREAKITQREVDFFNSKLLKPNEEFEGTRIFSLKKEVEDYNNFTLAKIDSPLKVFKATAEGDPGYLEKLRKNLPVLEELRLKKGALVVCRVNKLRDPDQSSGFGKFDSRDEYHNGLQGHVTSMDERTITLKTFENKIVYITKHRFEIVSPDNEVMATIEAFPLLLASSITSYRAQGLSLSRCILKLSQLFAAGQAYVCLSRSSDPKNLRILSWDRRSFIVDKEVVEFYKNMRK